MRNLIANRHARTERGAQLLAAFSYRGVLARGFALVRDPTGAPLPRVAAIAPGQALRIEFADGAIGATADGRGGEPIAKRDKARPGGGAQGSLF
jgi:exodeoxyribonuclease VII large subunit